MMSVSPSLPISTPPSVYVHPCPDTFPKNGREFPPGRPAHTPSRRPALSLLSCPAISSVTPMPNGPCDTVPLSPPPSPTLMWLHSHQGSVAPIYTYKYHYAFQFPCMLIVGLDIGGLFTSPPFSIYGLFCRISVPCEDFFIFYLNYLVIFLGAPHFISFWCHLSYLYFLLLP